MPTQFITNPRRPTKASSALTDTEKRDLRAAIMWAMDVEADGGEVPADIDRLFHADKWGKLTVAQARKVLRWFYATAPGNFVRNPRASASVSLYVVDTSPSGKVVTIRDATRDEIRLGDAMPHDQAVYWAGVFASETAGAKIRDTSSRTKKNPRRNPDTVTLRVPLSVHYEFQYLAVDGYVDGDPFYSPERVAFVEACRSARRAGKTYTYSLDPLALAYLPVVVSDGIEFAHNRQYGERDPSARARNMNLIKNLQKALADARAGGTKIKPPKTERKPATPSVTTLQDVLDIEPNKARHLKDAMDAGMLPPAEVLAMAARYMGGFGVQSRDGLSYVSVRSDRPETLAYDRDKGRYLVVSTRST